MIFEESKVSQSCFFAAVLTVRTEDVAVSPPGFLSFDSFIKPFNWPFGLDLVSAGTESWKSDRFERMRPQLQ